MLYACALNNWELNLDPVRNMGLFSSSFSLSGSIFPKKKRNRTDFPYEIFAFLQR